MNLNIKEIFTAFMVLFAVIDIVGNIPIIIDFGLSFKLQIFDLLESTEIKKLSNEELNNKWDKLKLIRDEANISIETPSAQIAIRGTDFTTTIDELGRSLIVLLPDENGNASGEIVVMNEAATYMYIAETRLYGWANW